MNLIISIFIFTKKRFIFYFRYIVLLLLTISVLNLIYNYLNISSSYKKVKLFHENDANNKQTKTKYILYHCDASCSGYADRIEGKKLPDVAR